MHTGFFENTLPPRTASLVRLFQEKQPSLLQSFYLSGGTGLSLQLGHRESEDLDFFNEEFLQPNMLEKELVSFGKLSETQLERGTLNTFLAGVKLQFLEYPYPLLEPLLDWKGIRISSMIDIACTKLQTVGTRGSKKDFIDIYFLLQKYTLRELLAATRKSMPQSIIVKRIF
jgi:hypothetical protein